MGKLTDITVKNAKCQTGINPDTGKPYGVRKLADGGGLFLFVSADGSKRWRYRYFIDRDGKKVEQLMSLGVYPDVTLAEARVAAAKAALLGDPGAARKAVKEEKAKVAENTFKAVSLAWLAERGSQWGEKYGSDLLKRLERYAFPLIGQRPMNSLEAVDVLACTSAAVQAGAVATARRMVPVFSRIFRYAKTRKLCSHIPTADFQIKDELPKAKRTAQPAVKQAEVGKLVQAIAGMPDQSMRLTLQLMMLLFPRANEILRGTWDEIYDHTDAGVTCPTWHIPGSRMKNGLPFLIPLAAQAVQILEELKTLARGSPWVFPGKPREQPVTSKGLLHAWERIGYKGIQTTHGLRRIASTALNDACDADMRPLFHKDAIERQLSHVNGGDSDEVRGAYNEAEYWPARVKMMCWWADRLSSM